MHDRIQELRAACLPFVTRSLRGPRRRRATMAAVLLGLLVLVLGAWLGQSSSRMAHDARVDLGLEINRWQRSYAEYLIIVDTPWEYEQLVNAQGRGHAVEEEIRRGWVLLDTAADPHNFAPVELQPLRDAARELRDLRADLVPSEDDREHYQSYFGWEDERSVSRLRAIIDTELTPRVEVYRSPLTAGETVRIIGVLAGALLGIFWLICAPLWVGVQLAQELHDNTLQPLTGTALTSRQLALGLASAGVVPLLIISGPLLVLTLGAAATAGRLIPALGMVITSATMAALLIVLSMLGALALGRRRPPSIVGVGLLALLGVTGILGFIAALNLDHDTIGLVAALPTAAPTHLLAEAFIPVVHLEGLHAIALDARVILAAASAAVLAAIGLRAVERRVSGTHLDGALTRGEGLVAALFVVALALATLPTEWGSARLPEFGPSFLAATAIAILPLLMILAGRVPGGDCPPSLRVVPVGSLLREWAAFIGIGLVLTPVVAGLPSNFHLGMIFGVIHLVWALSVVALMLLRGAALPTSILTKIWLLLCMIAVMIEYGCGCFGLLDNRAQSEMILPMGEITPVFGVFQLGLMAWIPWSLLYGLKPGAAAMTPDHQQDEAGT